jgi:hypothetical protein
MGLEDLGIETKIKGWFKPFKRSKSLERLRSMRFRWSVFSGLNC